MSLRLSRRLYPLLLVAAVGLSTFGACGGSSSPAAGGGGGGAGGAGGGGGGSVADGGASDAGTEAAVDAGGSPDGTPSRTSSCTPLSQETGTALNTYDGRLDGYLSYVVPRGGSGACNGDDSHVHLQVKMQGNIYDVAVDIGKFSGDVLFYESDMPLPGGAWSEGWHGGDILGYPKIGVHSGQFTPQDPATLGAKIASELTSVNHISVFGSSYSQGNGCHDVHYVDGANDGAIAIQPLAGKAHVIFLRFSTQSF